MTYLSPKHIMILDKNTALLQSGRETVAAAVLVEAGTKYIGWEPQLSLLFQTP
jgi:hypothetical protein